MIFIFGVILLIFVIGLIVSKGSIRRVFLSGLRFIFIAFALIAAFVWILFQYQNTTKTKKPESTYDHSAYRRAQQDKKADAIRVGNELQAMRKTMFYNETCYRAWGDSFRLTTEIYKKYEEDLEWKQVTPLELIFLIDEGLAEIGDEEVVIFHKVLVHTYVGGKEIPSWRPAIPQKRNDKVRKSTVPLSEYYYGPQPVKAGYTQSGYIAVVPLPKLELIEAKKQLEYRRTLEGEGLKNYNALYRAYEKYEAEGLYKR